MSGKFTKVCLALLLLLSMVGVSESKTQYVKGYYRKDGTYVKPYVRNSPSGGGCASTSSVATSGQ